MNEDRIDFQEAAAYLLSGPMGEGRFDASQPMPVEVEAAINLLVERTQYGQGSLEVLKYVASPILTARMAGLRHPVLTAILIGEGYGVLAVEDVCHDSDPSANLHEDVACRCLAHNAKGVILGRNFISNSILHLQALPIVVHKVCRTLECLGIVLQDVILVRVGAAPWPMLPQGPGGDPELQGFIRSWKP